MTIVCMRIPHGRAAVVIRIAAEVAAIGAEGIGAEAVIGPVGRAAAPGMEEAAARGEKVKVAKEEVGRTAVAAKAVGVGEQ